MDHVTTQQDSVIAKLDTAEGIAAVSVFVMAITLQPLKCVIDSLQLPLYPLRKIKWKNGLCNSHFGKSSVQKCLGNL